MAIQLAFIAGVPVLDLTEYGDIEMALAHLVHSDEDYANHYRKQADSGRHVILDNGAFEMQEQGHGMSIDEVLAAAERINATELVCSDVLYDGQATVDATREFISKADQRYGARFQYMGVVQGSTLEEFKECYERLSLSTRIGCIGLSKLSVPKVFELDYLANARPAALQYVTALHGAGTIGSPKPIHLLGGDVSLPQELYLYRHYKEGAPLSASNRIRSQDSSFAWWYAKAGIDIDRHTLHATKVAHGPYDFYAPLSTGQKSHAVRMIEQLLSIARQ